MNKRRRGARPGAPSRAIPTDTRRGFIMTDKPLDFDPAALGAFDAANDPADALAAFDAATGVTAVPAGEYTAEIGSGELVTTRTGRTAYRLKFVLTAPDAYAGFTLWRYHVLDDKPNADRAKAALAPLGLRTGADLRKPFPAGRVVVCRLVVGLQKDDPSRNDVLRFTVVSDTPAATTSTADRFALPTEGQGEGVKQ